MDISQCALLQSTPFRRERKLRPARFAYELRKRRKKIGLFRRPYLAWAAPPREQLYLYAGRISNVNGVTNCDGRTYVCESAYLAHLHIQRGNQRKRHLAASVNMHPKIRRRRRLTPLVSWPNLCVTDSMNQAHRYDGGHSDLRWRIWRYAVVTL